MTVHNAHTITTGAALLGASEFALSIALTVFIIVSLMLAAILALLYVSKSFRAFFFREEIKRQRAALKRKQEQAEKQRTLPDAVATEVSTSAEPSNAGSRTTRKRGDAYSDGVLTVPLTYHTAEKPRRKKKRTAEIDGITTVELPVVSSDPVTFTPRNVTVARAKKGATADPAPADKAGTTEKRAAKRKNI